MTTMACVILCGIDETMKQTQLFPFVKFTISEFIIECTIKNLSQGGIFKKVTCLFLLCIAHIIEAMSPPHLHLFSSIAPLYLFEPQRFLEIAMLQKKLSRL